MRRWWFLGAAVVLVVAAGAGVWLFTRSSPVAADPSDGITRGTVVITAATALPSPDTTGAVSGVLTDLDTFWTAELPMLGRPWTPLAGRISAVDPEAARFTGATPGCVGTPSQISANAYYCPTDDGIVYDAGVLVPVLLGSYGAAGLTASFAHEFGHAVQERVGPTAAQRMAHADTYPSLLVELQADCYSGVFLQAAVDGQAAHVRLDRSQLVTGVGALLDFADSPRATQGAGTAHGLALDRLRAVLRGMTGGAPGCFSLALAALHPTEGASGVVPSAAAARYPDDAALDTAAAASVSAFARTVAVAGDAVAAPADLEVAEPYGQFARAAATAWAVGSAAGHPACFVGAWTASVFGHTAAGGLGSWAGDADEALSFVRHRAGATFDDLAAYATGFDKGWPAC